MFNTRNLRLLCKISVTKSIDQVMFSCSGVTSGFLTRAGKRLRAQRHALVEVNRLVDTVDLLVVPRMPILANQPQPRNHPWLIRSSLGRQSFAEAQFASVLLALASKANTTFGSRFFFDDLTEEVVAIFSRLHSFLPQEEISGRSPGRQENTLVDFIVGGVPCQAFRTISRRYQ